MHKDVNYTQNVKRLKFLFFKLEFNHEKRLININPTIYKIFASIKSISVRNKF